MKKPAKGETGHIINAYRITGSLEKRQNTVYLWRTSELLDLNLNIPDPAMHLLWGIRLLGKLIFSICGSQHQHSPIYSIMSSSRPVAGGSTTTHVQGELNNPEIQPVLELHKHEGKCNHTAKKCS